MRKQKVLPKTHKSLTIRIRPPPVDQTTRTCNIKPFSSSPMLTRGFQSKLASPINISLLSSKPWEELHHENSALKLKIHSLSSQLGRQRVKQEAGSRNYKRIRDKLNLQYSQQLNLQILPKNSYLVQGIKGQYYKMKQKYEDKCNEVNQLLKGNTGQRELQVYVAELEEDNRRLKKRVQIVLGIEDELFDQMQMQQCVEIAENGGIQATKQWIQSQERSINEMFGVSAKMAVWKDEVQQANQQVKVLREQIQVQKGIMRQRKSKIMLLQRALRKKCNQIHDLQLDMKREIRSKNEQIDRYKQMVKKEEEKCNKALERMAAKEKNRHEAQKQIYNQYFRERQTQVQGLKKEIKSLKLMLSCNKQANNPSDFKRQRVKRNKSKETNKAIHQSQSKFRLTFAKQRAKSSQLSSDQQSNLPQPLPQKQLQKRSYVKHSQNCVKIQPVKEQQIKQYKKQLRYRFIYHKMPIDKVKQYFDPLPLLNTQESKGQTMAFKEIKQKLMEFPFSLAQEKAHLFARYIVQDCSKHQVYFHQDNEIQIAIVKSIIRAFVGDYPLPNQQQAKKQIKQMLSKKGKNLLSSLYFLLPQGFTNSDKLIEISNNLSIVLSQQTWQYMISHLFMLSKQKTEELDYSNIFTHFQ